MSVSVRRLRGCRGKSRRGVVAVLFALAIVVIMGMVAFAVDCGFMTVMKTEQQSSADAAALAGASVLYKDGKLNSANALDVARDYYERNTGRTAAEDNVQFAVGRWDAGAREFVANDPTPNAVRVLSTSADLPTFFGRVLNSESFKVSAKATACVPRRDIMFITDNSTSMRFNSKITMLRDAMQQFINTLNSKTSDRVDLSQIARRYSSGGSWSNFPGEGPRDHAELAVSLGLNKSRIMSHINSLGQPYGFTNISEGMQLALDEFDRSSRSGAPKLAILLTDGTANRPPTPGTTPPTTGCTYQNDPVPLSYGKQKVYTTADTFLAKKIPVFAISLSSSADQTLVKYVANKTNGIHFHIAGSVSSQAAQLNQVFNDIAAGKYDAVLVD